METQSNLRYGRRVESQIQDITLFELDVFSQLSRRKSLRSVARHKGLTPSHVSKVLRRLEKKLNMPLMKRSSTGVVLTPEGTHLLQSAESVLEHAERLHSRKQSGKAQVQKKLLSIGSVRFLSTHLLCPTVATMSDSHEAYRFRILELAPGDIVAAGLKGAFEVCVHVGALTWTKSWHTTQIGSIHWALFSRAKHPLKKNPSVDAIRKYPFVAPNYWEAGHFITGNDHCPLSWKERIKGTETSSAQAATEIIKHTDQLAFIPKLLAKPGLLDKSLREIQVKEWETLQKPVFVTAKSDVVSKKLYTALCEVLAENLENS